MYPTTFSGMSSYPYQRTQVPPPPQYYHPSWEPPQVKEEPSSTVPLFMYGPWPQNYGYPFPPMQCPSCSNNTQPQPQYPPYFNFRPPCPHIPPPPPAAYGHFYGGFPSFPVNYVPPPHYTTELPRYEYDKKDSHSHCCECSHHHHPCRLKEDKHVKIEEHEPEVETKKTESLVPVLGNNGFSSQPVLWFPPGYATMSKKEPRRRVVEDESEKQLVSPYYLKKEQPRRRVVEEEAEKAVKKPQQSVKSEEREPNVSYRWLPLDMNAIRELLEGGGDGKKSVKNVESKEQSSSNNNKQQFPFPIFWMPYGGQGEEENDVNKGDQGKETQVAPGFKVIPMRFEHPDSEPEKIKTAVGDDKSQASEKTTSTVKTIPVKPSEECVPKQVKKDEEQKDAQKHVKNAQGNNGNGNGNGHSSSPKKSKLSPICLRVDPPKKKNGNGNGSSRSPSPPVDKKRESTQIKSEGPKVEIIVPREEKKHEGDVEKKVVETQQQEEKESKPQEEKKPVRKVLSEQEAATKIQSVYRGHDVRRWEPLKKLRQIARIQEEANEVKRRIEGIGSSIDEKEKVAVAETIMKLLLKLDTIQGLPPSFRDVRRSVAKELIMLQEKLDSIISKKSTSVAHETSSSDEPSKVTVQDDECSNVVVETTEEPSKILNQKEGSKVVVDTPEEPKVDVEPLEETSKICSSQEVVSKVVVETNEEPKTIVEKALKEQEPSKIGQDEGSNAVVETLGEPSKILNQEEGSKVVVEATEEPSKVFNQDEGLCSKVVLETTEEPSVVSSQDEGSKVVVETTEEPSKVSAEDEGLGSKVVVETTEEPSKVSTLDEGLGSKVVIDQTLEEPSKVVGETLEEPSKISTQDEDSKAVVETLDEPKVVGETLEEPSNVSTLDEGSEVVAETLEEPEQVVVETLEEPSMISTQDEGSKLVVIETLEEPSNASAQLEGSKLTETVEETSSVSGSVIDESPRDVTETAEQESSKVVAGTKREESDGSVSVQGKQLNVESEEHPTETDNVEENTTEIMLIEHKDEQVNVVPEMPEKLPEDEKNEIAMHELKLKKEEATDEPKEAQEEVASKEPSLELNEGQHEAEVSPHESNKKGQEEAEQLDKRIMEENERLREMLERLIASGKQQQDLISSLSGKVKDLEQQLAGKKQKKNNSKVTKSSFRRPRVVVSRLASCGNGKLSKSNGSNGSLKGSSMVVAS